MADVLVGNLVETPATIAPVFGQKDFVDGRAVIGYKSILDDYDVSIFASSEASGFDVENIVDRLTYNGWKPNAGGTQTVEIVCESGKPVDYLAVSAHNLNSKGVAIDLRYSDDNGATWISAINGGFVPVSDAPFMVLFTRQDRVRFQVVLSIPGSDLPTIGVIMLGPRLSLQRGIYVGHGPAPFSRRRRFLTEESDGGQIIGSVVMAKASETDIDIKKITPAWYREFMDPFVKRAVDQEPFFWLWNTDDRYKGEVIYGVLTGEPSPVNEHQSFMALALSVRGLA